MREKHLANFRKNEQNAATAYMYNTLFSDFTISGNATFTMHSRLLYPSRSPVSWVRGLLDINHEELKYLVLLGFCEHVLISHCHGILCRPCGFFF